MKKDGVGKEVMVCEAEDVFSDDRAEGAVMEPNLAGWLNNFSFSTRAAGTGTLRCGSRLMISIHVTAKSPFLTKRFAYSRSRDLTVYVSPIMALSRNASMIHVVMACHLLSSCQGLLAIGIRQLKQHTQNGTDHERSYDQER